MRHFALGRRATGSKCSNSCTVLTLPQCAVIYSGIIKLKKAGRMHMETLNRA